MDAIINIKVNLEKEGIYMKRIFLAMGLTMVLAACGGNDSSSSESDDDFILYEDHTGSGEDEKKEDDEDANIDEKDEDESETKTETETETKDNEESDEESNQADKESDNELSSYDEYEEIHEHVDLDTYTGIVQTDNRGNRVILFEDEKGQKEYKSIFLKKKNRLKIIKLKNDELLFNEVL